MEQVELGGLEDSDARADADFIWLGDEEYHYFHERDMLEVKLQVSF
jgi:hypothetical protein